MHTKERREKKKEPTKKTKKQKQKKKSNKSLKTKGGFVNRRRIQSQAIMNDSILLLANRKRGGTIKGEVGIL